MAEGTFAYGQSIVFRHVWNGRSVATIPVKVLSDDDFGVVYYTMPGTPIRYMTTPRGERLDALVREEWELGEVVWSRPGPVTIVPAGAAFALELNEAFWYVNLQDPLRREAHGFDSMDHQLDLLAAIDGSEVQEKDRADFEEARARGLRTDEQHRVVEEAADAAKAFIRQRGIDLHERWRTWKPEPTWIPPLLPHDL